MPMIDIYAVAGTFADTKQLAIDAATTVKTIEGVPDIPMFRKNTAAFVHELPAGTLANVDGDETLCPRAGSDQRGGSVIAKNNSPW